jgi:hypothetical protein
MSEINVEQIGNFFSLKIRLQLRNSLAQKKAYLPQKIDAQKSV